MIGTSVTHLIWERYKTCSAVHRDDWLVDDTSAG